MKIQVIADTHFEFHPDGGQAFLTTLNPEGVDVIVVAGDLTTWHYLENALFTLADKYPHVIYVVGNHELYHSSRERLQAILQRIQMGRPNISVLQDSTVTIEGQRFVGSTLWFPDNPLSWPHRPKLNDFNLIQGFAGWVFEANKKAVEFLTETVTPDDVVVTHHVPAHEGVHPKWRGSPLNLFFVCDLTKLIEQAQPKLWLYGHTHNSLDFQIGSTRMICNPYGYFRRDENPDFDWSLKVEVEPSG